MPCSDRMGTTLSRISAWGTGVAPTFKVAAKPPWQTERTNSSAPTITSFLFMVYLLNLAGRVFGRSCRPAFACPALTGLKWLRSGASHRLENADTHSGWQDPPDLLRQWLPPWLNSPPGSPRSP